MKFLLSLPLFLTLPTKQISIFIIYGNKVKSLKAVQPKFLMSLKRYCFSVLPRTCTQTMDRNVSTFLPLVKTLIKNEIFS